MTTDKDFKRVVRRRAAAAGERYTAVRDQLLAEERDEDTASARVVGIESRYSAEVALEGERRLSAPEVVPYLFRRVVSWGRSSNVYLENGARLYVAADGVFEYATPECRGARKATCHVLAGELRAAQLADTAQVGLAEEGTRGELIVAADRSEHGGCHESYLVNDRLDAGACLSMLVPFLATRQVFAGVGGIVQTGAGPAQFVLSPRAGFISRGVAERRDDPTALCDIDAQPHADHERFSRVHVAVGDVNRSPRATFLKIGTTALVVRMLEEAGAGGVDLRLENPVRAVRDVSHDPSRPVRLASGRTATALEMQHQIWARLRAWSTSVRISGEERRLLSAWRDVLADLDRGFDHDPLASSVDWLHRRRAIDEVGGAASPDAVGVNRAADSLAAATEVSEMPASVCTPDEIAAAVHDAPTTTRARLRGEFIKACTVNKRDYTVDWTHLKLNTVAQRTIVLNDPTHAVDPRVDKLLASVIA